MYAHHSFIFVIDICFLLLTDITATDYSCFPNEDCKTSTVQGFKVPDPLNCTNYYLCLGSPPEMYPADSSLSCPEGQYFNTDIGICEYDDGKPCNNTCEIEPNYTCKSKCRHGNLYAADPNYCNTLYFCPPNVGDGVGPEMRCNNAPYLYFNGSICQEDERKCCNLCDANCVELDVQIADPKDCRKLYICLALGNPTEDMHTDCPEGQHFDPDEAVCTQGSTCSPLCGSVRTTITVDTTTEVQSTKRPSTSVITTTDTTTVVRSTKRPSTSVITTTDTTTEVQSTKRPSTSMITTTDTTTEVQSTIRPFTYETTTRAGGGE